MENKLVKVGIFWAIPDKISGQLLLEFNKRYLTADGNSNRFINYPYSHFEVWNDEVKGLGDDCYKYPRGRVIYDVSTGKHRIFADKCILQSTIDDVIECFEIEEYDLLYDEHYVCSKCQRGNERTARNMGVTGELKYKILRGEDTIGGNLIEIAYGDTRLLVDFGRALDGGDELSELERKVIATEYDAVILTHYHTDHAGLIGYKNDCKFYMGKGTRNVLSAVSDYNGEQMPSNLATFTDGKPFKIGEILVTPYLCDHSAFDSYMLLFEVGGKSLLYTGDFRFHGRKSSEALLKRLPKRVDTLIYEGTNVGRAVETISERELEEKLVQVMRKNKKPVFVLQSGTNIDRLVSVYRASKRAGRVLYEDNYTALVANAAGGSIPRPDVFDDVFAFTPRRLCGRRYDTFAEIENRISTNQICESDRPFTMLVRPSMLEYIEKLDKKICLSGSTLVYSMWGGYKQDVNTSRFLEGIRHMSVDVVDLHTSGHATKNDIERLKSAVCAKEEICVHTKSI